MLKWRPEADGPPTRGGNGIGEVLGRLGSRLKAIAQVAKDETTKNLGALHCEYYSPKVDAPN